MRSHLALEAIAGIGFRDDRYATGLGYWAYDARYVSHVTFIGEELLAQVAAALGAPFVAAESRRNIVTRGVALLDLIGREFHIGTAVFAGERPCEPCRYLETLTGKPVRAELARDGGGLRAHCLRGGTVTVGDALVLGDR